MEKMLTTGQIASYCGVNYQTAIRWVKRGELKAFQLPGRGDRRIQINDFLEFLKQKNIPIPSDFKDKGPQKVLIVDDEINIAKSIERVLKRKGFKTKIATNGFQAGLLAEQFQPDLLTLDLNMPGLNGYDVLKYLKSSNKPPYSNIKILVISALSLQELLSSLNLGADDFLEKPFENKKLIEKVTSLLNAESKVK